MPSMSGMRRVIQQQQGVDKQLSANIRAIEAHLEHLHDERMYLEAAKVQEELEKLKAQRHEQSTTYWVKRHERTISGLREQREGLFASAGKLLTEKLKIAQEVYNADISELKDRHHRELQLLQGALSLGVAGVGSSYSGGSGRRASGPGMNNATEDVGASTAKASGLNAASSPKYSAKVLSLLTSEKRLARGRMYARAAKAREDAEKLMALERDEQAKAEFKVRQGKISRLRLQHKQEEQTLRERFENQRRRLVSECRNDQKLISVRVRKTRSELSRARNLRVAMTTSSSPVLSKAALKASIRGERAAAELPISASPERVKSPGNHGRVRPKSALSSSRRRLDHAKTSGARPGSAPMRRNINAQESLFTVVSDGSNKVSRPGSRSTSQRPWSSASNRSLTNRRAKVGKRRRKKNRKMSEKSKSSQKTCFWCGESDGHIARIGGLSIPNPSRPREGTGCFCSWECATSYVFKYFPIQDRYMAELLIQDAAGFLVRRSTRPHNRLQGPGIPSNKM